MIGLGTLAKFAKGTLSQDELAELLAQFGMELEMRQVGTSQANEAFKVTAVAALQPQSSILAIRGRMQNGDQIEALIVMVPCSGNKKTG